MSSFEIDPARAAELGAPVEDVAQEAVDATATAYANDAAIHVERHLQDQLGSRGLRADDRLVAEIGERIRSGHGVAVGRSDGTVDERGAGRAEGVE